MSIIDIQGLQVICSNYWADGMAPLDTITDRVQ